MKKMVMTLVAVCCCVLTTSAQEARNCVYDITLGHVEYVHHDEKMSAGEAVGQVLSGALTGKTSVQASKYESDVKAAITKGLSGAYRFHFNDGLLRVKDVVTEGNLVADALITNIQATSSSRTWKDKDDKLQVSTTYRGIVEVTMTLKDAKTFEIVTNKSLRGSGPGSSAFSPPDQAIRDAIGRLAGSVSAWRNRYKPREANIIEGSTTKKDKQKEVYIDLGKAEGAFEGLHMYVYQVKKIAGREAKSQIGKLKIEAVEGDDISRCKVQSGGKDIKACLEAGEQLVVMSRDM